MKPTRKALPLVLLIAAGWAGGCGSTITPPARTDDPVSVFIADHGIHSSLLLPGPDGGVVQFGFSRWSWAAEDQDDLVRAPFALLIPGQAALGRRGFAVEPCGDAITSSAVIMDRHPPIGMVYELRVERARAERLRDELDARFARCAAAHAGQDAPCTGTFNAKRGMYWVRDDGPDYWLAHNCNHHVNTWLREMGCDVRGLGAAAEFTVIGCTPRRRGPQG